MQTLDVEPDIQCWHLSEIRTYDARSPAGCEECLHSGDAWVHLRLCLRCGHVGCCNSSKNKHATRHFHGTDHPVIASYERGEGWRWCFVDEVMWEDAPVR